MLVTVSLQMNVAVTRVTMRFRAAHQESLKGVGQSLNALKLIFVFPTTKMCLEDKCSVYWGGERYLETGARFPSR